MEINLIKCDKCGKIQKQYESDIKTYISEKSGIFHLCSKCGNILNSIISKWLREENK